MSIKFDASGSATTLDKAPLSEAGVIAARETLEAFAQSPQGIIQRFTHESFGRLGLTRRSQDYQKKQISIFGTTLPYVSPRNNPNKFRDLIRVPNVGHRVVASDVQGNGVAIMTAAAARGLNFHRMYLAQWSRLHSLEESQIMNDLHERLGKRIEEALDG